MQQNHSGARRPADCHKAAETGERGGEKRLPHRRQKKTAPSRLLLRAGLVLVLLRLALFLVALLNAPGHRANPSRLKQASRLHIRTTAGGQRRNGEHARDSYSTPHLGPMPKTCDPPRSDPSKMRAHDPGQSLAPAAGRGPSASHLPRCPCKTAGPRHV